MEKEFIPYEQALALKELGFDEPCMGYRDGGGKLMIKQTPHCVISAPTFQQAFRWFREKYKYSSYIKEATKDKYRFYIEKFDEKFYNSEILIYEEAELECLLKLIEIVKEK
jgi:hypothetical protein